MAARILLVEDNEKLALNIREFLLHNSAMELEILWADNGQDGLELALEDDYDLILLDVMLPKMDGFTVCKRLRKEKDVTIIFMTAKSEENDVLTGYTVGGDDYLIKPFSLAQLSAKLNAVLKRIVADEEKLVRGNIVVEPGKARVSVAGEIKHLPLKEYDILKELMEKPDRLISKESLIINVWGYDADITERVLDNHIKKLRKEIDKADYEITTLRKQGYIFTKKHDT